ncbi:membrane spanning protein [Staphylococcus argenteus]|nr:membrane spanning protein [Staphylococcus argenteus]SGX49439.1 membrane spanning protein [Staphylococcus argenteus]SGX73314.1 membrane spanning protein [Staphylococcus argenteus]SHC52179.1 membrane spanning protein [Staphylococcus argenteus]SHD55282.1 membrane spanning protein [Staphylococcus argenteus]
MMKVRITFIILAILSTIVCLFLAAMHPTGPNTVTFQQPYLFTLNIIMMILVALPALVLAIYDNMSFRVSSAILQILGAISWFFLSFILSFSQFTSFTVGSFITSIILFVSAIITLAIGGKSVDKNDSH